MGGGKEIISMNFHKKSFSLWRCTSSQKLPENRSNRNKKVKKVNSDMGSENRKKETEKQNGPASGRSSHQPVWMRVGGIFVRSRNPNYRLCSQPTNQPKLLSITIEIWNPNYRLCNQLTQNITNYGTFKGCALVEDNVAFAQKPRSSYSHPPDSMGRATIQPAEISDIYPFPTYLTFNRL